ncbi:hypothetical protein FHR32_003715 [Streptosporangium album]|uniref:Uncharacterized protein n=1 Tax=Streptosporangium album TaxID=47479 RepID=A0A7W7RWF0_9ACTN|nr:hypothetical protein [Streptosporangium album]
MTGIVEYQCTATGAAREQDITVKVELGSQRAVRPRTELD